MMINPKACFSKHSQWPLRALASLGLRAYTAFILPWIGRLRAFASPGLRAYAVFNPSLDV